MIYRTHSNFFKLFFIFLFIYSFSFAQDNKSKTPVIPDSLKMQNFMSHLRKNFDDIHDVSMRFHHKDYTIGGRIVFEMKWHKGKLQSAEVLQNETGETDLGIALIEKFKKWDIKNLGNEFEITLPLRIKLVGSGESGFSECAILTGFVHNEKNEQIDNARIEIISTETGEKKASPARSNREGIFVRTLIPAGKWKVICTHTDYKTVILQDIDLNSGEHEKLKIKMERKNR